MSVYLDTATALGERLCADAIWDGERCTWMGASMELVGGEWRQSRRTFGGDPYAGTSGVALFLAQLHRFRPSEVLRRTALGALAQAFDRVEKDATLEHGALYTGIFGIGFSAAEAGAELDADTAVTRGLELVRANLNVDETAFDIVSGGAGRIGALLRLHARFGHDWLLEGAAAEARHLIETAHRSDKGWSWGFGGTKYVAHDLTGYSHGAAGAALALLEVYTATSDEVFQRAADEAIRYERAWFSESQQNWPDFRRMPSQRENDPYAYGFAWCHGAPGIGMSRLRAFELTRRDDLRDEALIALRSTRNNPAGIATEYSFGLCHGTAGNAELFLRAWEVLGDQEGLTFAESLADKGIAEYGESGKPWPSGLDEAGEAPGLMLGLAGIGYFYLRLHGKRSVPSLLTVSG